MYVSSMNTAMHQLHVDVGAVHNITIGAKCCSIAASSARATIHDDFGFVGEGLLTIERCISPYSLVERTICVFPFARGSQITDTRVVSKPLPASASAAATLRFCG